MLALSSELEGVGREGLQVLQKVGIGRLKAHFLLKGDIAEYRVKSNESLGMNKPFCKKKKKLSNYPIPPLCRQLVGKPVRIQ